MTRYSPTVQRAARIIARTHTESLHAFYVRAAQNLSDAGLLNEPPQLTRDEEAAS